MTNPSRPRSFRGLAVLRQTAFACAFSATLLTGSAMAADAVKGEKLAKKWCASCHIVSVDQTRGADIAPPFASIARRPSFSADRTARFLMHSHPRMPGVHLTRDEAKNLAAYIAGLAH